MSEKKGLLGLLLKVELHSEATGQADTILDILRKEFQNWLGLRIEIASTPAGSLPRYEFKARRFKKNTDV